MSTRAGHSTAHLAVDAEVGRLLELPAGKARQGQLAGQHAADQVGLRPRRGLFGRQDAEDRAHPHRRGLAAAIAAAVAGADLVDYPRRVPVELQFQQIPHRRRAVAVGAVRFSLARRRLALPGFRDGGAEILEHQVRVVADDLPRVEDALGIEDPLHLAKDIHQIAELPPHVRRAA